MLFEMSEEGDLVEAVRIFKQTTSRFFRRFRGEPLWQRSYYDRILRRDEATAAVARYLLNNPVRRGLVTDARAYPFIGSFVAPVDEWL
jgi:REP element-mobilizing transposase RayT